MVHGKMLVKVKRERKEDWAKKAFGHRSKSDICKRKDCRKQD